MEQQKLDSSLDTTPIKIKQSCLGFSLKPKLSQNEPKSEAAELPDCTTDVPQQDKCIEDQTQSTASEVDTDTKIKEGSCKRRKSKLAGAEEKTCYASGDETQREPLHSYLGPLEVAKEVEEVDLHQDVTYCEKSPDHKDFIPVDQFTLAHLPASYQVNIIFDYTKFISDLTCRLSINYISEKRPDLIPGTSKSYPFIEKRGKKLVTRATGWVANVEIFKDIECVCEECQKSSLSVSQFAIIKICTSTHAVFNKKEAKSTTCHLYFDHGRIPESCSKVLKLEGLSGFHHEINSDEAELGYVTHDIKLAEDLLKKLQDMRQLRSSIRKWLLNSGSAIDDHPLVIIVSHPHGCSKMVSIGHCVDVEETSSHVQLIYTAPSCPGSSGAPVNFLGTRFWYRAISHSGFSDENKLNMSGGKYFIPDSWMTKNSFTHEADLYRHHISCQKNPGHTGFIPVDTFSLEHLPSRYRDNTVVEYIRAWADLTARFTVSYVSPMRPEKFPGTDTRYPFYENRGSYAKSIGTGWVDNMQVFPQGNTDVTTTCDCKECQSSDSPRKEFAHIKLIVVRHVVFDDSEAKYTSCHLFYDNGDLLSKCSTSVELNGMSVVWANTDSCMIQCTIHDLELAMLLKRKLENLSALERKVATIFVANSTVERPLSVIVSHPHGCSKKISVGSLIAENDNACLYDTATCPGCSGAPVICQRDKFVVCFTSIHSGNTGHAKNLNYSCCSSSFLWN